LFSLSLSSTHGNFPLQLSDPIAAILIPTCKKLSTQLFYDLLLFGMMVIISTWVWIAHYNQVVVASS
jgi:hypothetical protein